MLYFFQYIKSHLKYKTTNVSHVMSEYIESQKSVDINEWRDLTVYLG